MRLTIQELDEMQRVDIGATNADTLPDVSGMAFQKGLSREERIIRFMQGAKNLYCYCVEGVGVKIEFAENGPSLQDTLGDFLIRAKAGCNFGYGPFWTSRQSVPRLELSKASLLSLPNRGII